MNYNHVWKGNKGDKKKRKTAAPSATLIIQLLVSGFLPRFKLGLYIRVFKEPLCTFVQRPAECGLFYFRHFVPVDFYAAGHDHGGHPFQALPSK